jgi:hypothetical protein
VKLRASRTAFMVASVPELVKRRDSRDGTRRVRVSASLISCSVGPGKDIPSVAASWAAFTTSGWAWPTIKLV